MNILGSWGPELELTSMYLLSLFPQIPRIMNIFPQIQKNIFHRHGLNESNIDQ